MKIGFLYILLIILSSNFAFLTNAKAAINNSQRQEQIIRHQQKKLEQEQRDKDQQRIKKEREKLKKLKPKTKKKLHKKSKLKTCFPIKTIKIIGAKSLSKKQQKKLTSPHIGKCFSAKILSKLTQETTTAYHKLGLITSQVTIPKQNIASGHLSIQIIEGKIEDIILNQNKFTDKMQSFTAFGFSKNKILNVKDVNQGISQINRLISNNAAMKIEPGTKIGYSKIIVRNEPKHRFRANLAYDNLGSDFTGIKKTTLSTSIDNLLFLNDQINLSYSNNRDDPNNQKDLKSFTAGLIIPYRYNLFSYNYSRTKYLGLNPGNDGPIKLSGYSNNNNFSLERTILNNRKYRIAPKLTIIAKESASYLNDSKIETSVRKLTIGSASLAISKFFKNGTTIYFKPQYLRGLKLLNADKDEQALANDIPRAQFQLYKFYATISKKITIPKINLPINLSSEFDSQIAKNTLFGSEQFSVGGYYSVRSFRENNISGDHGYYLRNNAKINLGQLLAPKIAKSAKNKFLNRNAKFLYQINFEPFYDYGYVKIKHNKETGRLSAAGIKTTFSAKNFDASLTSAWSIGKSHLITSDKKENKMIYFELKAKCCN